jgi:putative membrane protein
MNTYWIMNKNGLETFRDCTVKKLKIKIMNILSQLIVGFIALLHLYILWLEMFAWTTNGKKVFKNIPEDQFEKTKVMAANQGLYNGFLAGGLIWSLCVTDLDWSKNIAIFFLSCVLIAGIYGAMTASKRIFFVQAVPAILGLLSFMLQI